MKRIRISGMWICCILLICTSSVHASTLMFTDRSTWQNNVSNPGFELTNIDFENAARSADGFSVFADDVTFSSPGIPLEVRDYGIPYDSGLALYPSHNQPIQIELPDNVYAFGFDLGELGGIIGSTELPTLSNVVLSTGEVFAGPYYGNAFPTFAFFGFSSDTPIASLSMAPHALIEPIIDNFTYAQAAIPTPEPSSLFLLGSGLLSVVAGGWRNRRSGRSFWGF